jgi:hypothetical protein
MPFMYCDPPSPIAHIRPATGPAHYQHGLITLRSGATVEISVADGEPFLTKLRPVHRLQICYAPSQMWADEPPDARRAIVGDLETKEYIYTVAVPGSAARR